MSALVSRWKVRDPAKMRDWGLATLQVCRAQRGRPEVVDARYYISTPSEFVIHMEFEPGVQPSQGTEIEECAKAGIDLLMVAECTGVETWTDARRANEAVTLGGLT